MKIKGLLAGMLAFAAAVACQEIVPDPTLEVDKTEVALAATSGEATIKVSANNAWTVSADAAWVIVTPAEGAATTEPEEVKVSATDNEATEARTATVTVKSGALTKTVAVTQAGATAQEPTPEPEPEPEPAPTPEVDWTSEAVVSYDLPEGASEKRQVLKNIKYQYDAEYFYVKLEASKALFSEPATEFLGVFIYDVTNGSGDGYYGWWNSAAGNNEYEGEHVGTFTGTDLSLTIGETPIAVEKEENGDVLTWTLFIPRSAHANLATENPSFAFMTYVGWEPNGALPDKYDNMLQFTPAAEPEPEPEPEPGLEQSDWNIVGSFTGSGWGWDAAAGIPLYVLDENYFVLYGLELTEGAQFKFLQGTAWGGAEVGASYAVVEPNTIQAKGGQNIAGLPAGKYDVYLAADASKFYIMSEGKTPAEATEPTPVEATYTVAGTIADAAWNNAAPIGLMTKEGNYYVAKNIPFIWSSTAYAAYGNTDDQIELKIFVTGDWNQGWGAAAEGVKELNAEVAVSPAGGNIIYKNPEGTYDVYFDLENLKVWLMEAGKKPGEGGTTEPEPETPAGPVELATVLSAQSNVANGTNSVTINIATEGVTAAQEGWSVVYKGNGHYLAMDVYSTDGKLAPGTYTACAVGGQIAAGEFGIGWDPGDLWNIGMVFENWGTCWWTVADGVTSAQKVLDGTLTVEKSGDTYTITLESSTVNAKYVGALAL